MKIRRQKLSDQLVVSQKSYDASCLLTVYTSNGCIRLEESDIKDLIKVLNDVLIEPLPPYEESELTL